jgi:hypothetical protein
VYSKLRDDLWEDLGVSTLSTTLTHLNLGTLKTETDQSTRLTYTGLFGELEHLKIKMRLIDEKFVSVMGVCV